MGLVGIEAVLAAITTKLQTDLPAKVTALNTAYGDAYVLTDIAADAYYSYVPELEAASFNFPAVVLLDDGHGAESEQSNNALYVCRYAVVVDLLVRGDDAAELSYLLRRYTRAVKELLVARHSLAPTCTACDWDATSQHRITLPDSGDYLQDMASRFIVLTAETTS